MKVVEINIGLIALILSRVHGYEMEQIGILRAVVKLRGALHNIDR
jgi:hypothetical protein